MPQNSSMRSHILAELGDDRLVGQTVSLCGWVAKRRDLGGLVFIDLRERGELLQVVVEPDSPAFADASRCRNEYCIRVEGEVRARPESQVNARMTTGRVELLASKVTILNASEPVPLLMSDEDGEDTRLRYRYLDLRRPRMQHNLRLRSRLYKAIREFLGGRHFDEFETPILTRATPEGARDYLVPSRVNAGHFYALPQSPQIFKQLFMMAGMDRYYQIARCFRDEDLRADRQPEFTQLDIEMSFISEQDIQGLTEDLVRYCFEQVLDVTLPDSFPRLSWQDAMERYGSDKPDLRIPLQLVTVDEIVAGLEFKVFSGPAGDAAGRVALLRVPGGASLSRKQIDGYTELVGKHGGKGLAWIKVNDPATGLEGIASPVAKFLDEQTLKALLDASSAEAGDILLFGAGDRDRVNQSMGALRLALGRDLDLVEAGWQPLWVTDFPMFEWDEESGRYYAMHHPFTAPVVEKAADLRDEAHQAVSRGYDLVLNGSEIGGGSIRIHDHDMQQAVFDLLGIDAEEAEARFGFLLRALRYGCPPHGGIAFGLDRMVALMAGEASIRDVIAYPKTTTAHCPLTEAPSTIEAEQLAELGIRVVAPGDHS